MIKICYKCNFSGNDSFFKPKTNLCKKCYSNYISQWIKKDPQRIKKNRLYAKNSKKTNRARNKKYLFDIKLKTPCIDCKLFYYPDVLEFDHKPGLKISRKYTISDFCMRCTFEDLLKELEKCELVCANCHRIRTVKRRIGEDKYNLWAYSESNREP